jgi:hypothetical protein
MFSVVMSKVYGAISIALLCFLAITVIQNMGLKAQVKHEHAAYVAWHDAAVKWKANSEGWEASYRASEANRVSETTTARNAVGEANSACSRRIAEATRSTRAIRSIVNAPVTSCAGRPVVSADRLRDALAGPSDTPH